MLYLPSTLSKSEQNPSNIYPLTEAHLSNNATHFCSGCHNDWFQWGWVISAIGAERRTRETRWPGLQLCLKPSLQRRPVQTQAEWAMSRWWTINEGINSCNNHTFFMANKCKSLVCKDNENFVHVSLIKFRSWMYNRDRQIRQASVLNHRSRPQ